MNDFETGVAMLICATTNHVAVNQLASDVIHYELIDFDW